MGLFLSQEPAKDNQCLYRYSKGTQILPNLFFMCVCVVWMDIIFSVHTTDSSWYVHTWCSYLSVTDISSFSHTSILLPPLSSVLFQVLSQGSSNRLYGKTGQQHLEGWFTDPCQTNRLQTALCIIVTAGTSGSRRRLITLTPCEESLQALKYPELEWWICQYQLLWALQRDAHEVLLPCLGS